jgi:dCMP deaminase
VNDNYFMSLAVTVSAASKDRSTKVGCVVVGPDNEIRSTGFNGFPRGVNDNAPERHERPAKYLWTEHAERNAIYNAARMGTALKHCRLYCTFAPCMDCARAIVQAGICEVITPPMQLRQYQEDALNRV